MNIPYRTWNRRSMVFSLLGITMILLIAVLFMPAVAHVHRWFRFGPFSIQPSEPGKLALILFLAYHLSRKQGMMESFWHTIFPSFLVAGQMAFLIILQPDLGTALLYAGITIILLFLAGIPWRYLIIPATAAIPAFYFLVMNVPYRWERLLVFLNPDQDPSGSGFQILQSFIAVGSGGMKGVGLANGIQKLFYLPEAHTDFIYAIVGEELGLIGTGTVLMAFLFFLWRGLRIAWNAPDSFGQFLAAGITIIIALQALINMSVVIGILPTKGLPLPFVSSGGSSLLINMIGVGVLLNISQHT